MGNLEQSLRAYSTRYFLTFSNSDGTAEKVPVNIPISHLSADFNIRSLKLGLNKNLVDRTLHYLCTITTDPG